MLATRSCWRTTGPMLMTSGQTQWPAKLPIGTPRGISQGHPSLAPPWVPAVLDVQSCWSHHTCLTGKSSSLNIEITSFNVKHLQITHKYINCSIIISLISYCCHLSLQLLEAAAALKHNGRIMLIVSSWKRVKGKLEIISLFLSLKQGQYGQNSAI